MIKNDKRGFSLIEVMIGIMILTVAIVSATNLVVGLTSSNKNNVSTLKAFYLAQEGVEAVRNIRDSNWLHNLNWLHTSVLPWGTDFEIGETYRIDEKLQIGAAAVTEVDFTSLAAFAPWQLSSVGAFSDEEFIRTISLLPYECGLEDCSEFVLVESKVEFKVGSQDREVAVQEILTDWK